MTLCADPGRIIAIKRAKGNNEFIMLSSEIILFANAYSCPLGKRCEDCTLKNLSEVPLAHIYRGICKLGHDERDDYVADCLKCQKSHSVVNEVEEGTS